MTQQLRGGGRGKGHRMNQFVEKRVAWFSGPDSEWNAPHRALPSGPGPFSPWRFQTRRHLHQGLPVLLPLSPPNAEELKVKVKVQEPSRRSLQVPATGRDFSKSCICLAFRKYLKVTYCAYFEIFNIKDNISNFFTSSFLRYSSV